MSAAKSLMSTFRRRFSVGRFTCDVSAQLMDGKAVALDCQWSPHLPSRLSPVLLKEYQQKRNRAYAALAEQLGGPVLIADFDGERLIPVAIHPDGRIDVIEDVQP